MSSFDPPEVKYIGNFRDLLSRVCVTRHDVCDAGACFVDATHAVTLGARTSRFCSTHTALAVQVTSEAAIPVTVEPIAAPANDNTGGVQ